MLVGMNRCAVDPIVSLGLCSLGYQSSFAPETGFWKSTHLFRYLVSDTMEVYTVLIAGASRGIGLEFVRQLAPTMNVIATYRGTTEPADLQTIRATYPSLRLEPLDVTDTAQV